MPLPSESAKAECSGIGAQLRAGRERAGMTVLQAAEKLRIEPRMLEALEAEQFDFFGAPVFVRGHIQHYAQLLDQPFAPLRELFEARLRAAAPDLTRAPRAPRYFDRRRLLRPTLFVLIAIALAFAVWWVLKKGV